MDLAHFSGDHDSVGRSPTPLPADTDAEWEMILRNRDKWTPRPNGPDRVSVARAGGDRLMP